jgi:hypothetical protein
MPTGIDRELDLLSSRKEGLVPVLVFKDRFQPANRQYRLIGIRKR